MNKRAERGVTRLACNKVVNAYTWLVSYVIHCDFYVCGARLTVSLLLLRVMANIYVLYGYVWITQNMVEKLCNRYTWIRFKVCGRLYKHYICIDNLYLYIIYEITLMS